MSTAEWLGILFTVVGLAVGYGVLKGRTASLREEHVEVKGLLAAIREELRRDVTELRASNERQGERIGALEQKSARLEERDLSRPYRISKDV